jgi:hypothetical protein
MDEAEAHGSCGWSLLKFAVYFGDEPVCEFMFQPAVHIPPPVFGLVPFPAEWFGEEVDELLEAFHQKTKWSAMAATLMAVTIWQMSSAVMVKVPLLSAEAASVGGFGDSYRVDGWTDGLTFPCVLGGIISTFRGRHGLGLFRVLRR